MTSLAELIAGLRDRAGVPGDEWKAKLADLIERKTRTSERDWKHEQAHDERIPGEDDDA